MKLWNPFRKKNTEQLFELIRTNRRSTKVISAAIKRADLSATDDRGNTALHLAAGMGQLRTVKLLLDAGIDAEVQNISGICASHMAPDNVVDVIRSHLRSIGRPLPDPRPEPSDGPDIEPDNQASNAAQMNSLWPPEMIERLVALPSGFASSENGPIMVELGVGNLFAVQCAVQIAMHNNGQDELSDDLIRTVATRLGGELSMEAAAQVGQHLPKYAAAYESAVKSGTEALEAIMNAIAWTFNDYLVNIGAPDDKSLELIELMTKSCTDSMKLTIATIDEHYAEEPEPAVVSKDSEQSDVTEWIAEKLRNWDKTQTDKLEFILRHAVGARDFLRIATGNGFHVVEENHMGLTIAGPNIEAILTVLASKGADNIYTFSVKEGDKPAETLIDEGQLRSREVVLVHDDSDDVPIPDPPTNEVTSEGTNPLVLAVKANDATAVQQLLATGWSECEEVRSGELYEYAVANGLTEIAEQVAPYVDE